MPAKLRLKYDPYGIIIDQTTLCNQNCSFCHRSLKSPQLVDTTAFRSILPYEIYTKIIDQAAQVDSVRWLSLCGPMGDPLLVPDLVERFEYAWNKHHFDTILINTNGQALDLHDPERMLRSCTMLQFSVDSIREETYAKIHCGGKLHLVINNIRRLSSIKKRLGGTTAAIRIRFTENEYNLGEWEEYREFFEPFVDNVFRVKVHSFMGILDQYQTRLGAVTCNQPFNVINFNFRGELTTCCINWKLFPTFGSIKDTPIHTLWESDEVERWRENRMSTTCGECGGVGTFQQRVDFTPNSVELVMAENIARLGEKKYYEEKWFRELYEDKQSNNLIKWVRRLLFLHNRKR